MTKRLLAPVASVALAAALAAGCAPAPGTAATVNGQVIGENEVAAAVADLGDSGLAATPSQVIVSLVTAQSTIDIGAENGIGASTADAQAALDAVAEQNGLQPVEASDSTLRIIQSILVSNSIQGLSNAADLSAEYTDDLAALDVELNPRYGTWDPSGSVLTPVYDWIIAPAATAP